jgi:hypothetical protein
MTTIDTIFQNFLDRLASIPKKHLDVVVAQLETTKSDIIELFENSSKPKKTKKPTVKKEKKKDEVVKKPLSSYMLFCKDRRGVITSENVGITPQNVSKKLGEAWKSLSDNEKAVYIKKSSEEKSRYEETTGLTNVKKENSETSETSKTSKTSKTSDPIEEKKSLSPYIRFCNEKRPSVKESHPEMDGKTIIKTLGAMWRALSEEEQQSYKMM